MPTKKRKSSKKPNPPRCRAKSAHLVKTKISPQLIWTYPYLLKAKRKMPSLVMPRQIRPYRPNSNRIMRVLGNVYFEKKLIVIATHTQLTGLGRKGNLKVKKVIRLPKSQILDTLAHELAHFRYPDHGYEHEEYTRVIFKTFGLKEKCPNCKGSGRVELGGRS